MPRFARVSAGLAVAGGVAWVAACLALASLPTGCVDEECATKPERDWTPTATALFVLAFALVVGSAAGLVLLASRSWVGVRRLERLGPAAAVTGGLGVVVLVVGVLLAGLDAPGMENSMPAFVVPGVVLLIVAAGLTAWLVIRSRLLPVWLAVVMGASAALLLFVNEQTDSVLLAIPFGLVWALTGVLLVKRTRAVAAEAPRAA